jgi:ADP-heptose:LPS heptosyltransferase
MKILVRRTGALGDVVLATPIVRWLKERMPDSNIDVETAYEDVFFGNPHIDSIVTSGYLDENYAYFDAIDAILDLNLAYERRPDMHIVEAYFVQLIADNLGPTPVDNRAGQYRQEMFFDRSPVFRNEDRPAVAVHAAVAGWANRTLPRGTWAAVVEGIKAAGMRPILVGTGRDDILGSNCQRFLVPDIHAQARLINSCACFVGSDSGLLHVAGCTDTPIVGVFTCARPEFRLPYRDDCVAIVPPGLDCLFCLERQPIPSTTESCSRGDVACVSAVLAKDIVEAVIKMVEKRQ